MTASTVLTIYRHLNVGRLLLARAIPPATGRVREPPERVVHGLPKDAACHFLGQHLKSLHQR